MMKRNLYFLPFLFAFLLISCESVENYLEKDDFDNAILYADKQTGEDQIEAYHKIGDAYLVKENYDEAINYFTKANAQEKIVESQSLKLLNILANSTVNDTLNRIVDKYQVENLIEKGAKANLSDKNKWTSLHFAVKNCSEIEKIYVKKKQELEPIMKEQEINIAKAKKDYEIKNKEAERAKKRGSGALYQMDVLLAVKKLDLDVKLGGIALEVNKKILEHAKKSFEESKEIIQLLLKNGGDLNAGNNEGKKPVDLASETMHSFIDSIK